MPRKRPPRREVALPTPTRRERQILKQRAAGEIPVDQYRRCTARHRRDGRQCKRWAIIGGYVCMKHGGASPKVREKAKERLLRMLDPTLARLQELRDQDEHPPTALGACVQILNRTLGVAGKSQEERKTPVINIGIAMGAAKPLEPADPVRVALPAAAIEAALVDDDEDDDDGDPFTEGGIPKGDLAILKRG